ncbi:FecR domain-containing protein [Danxiaibacter flavus]|uniref:FecR domain-containing protein n=1 Tax=Danxiaibacter flavus TaxID=3049108 RepID=A0ABV3ZI61_9BACT|nr:FecR domain-containing protein [Chitinophagaceae bacterium DXS]
MHSHYNDYKEEDFLLDESFIRYCLGTDAVAIKFWKEWLEKNPDKKTIVENAKRLYFLLNGNNKPAQLRRHEADFRQQFQQHLEAGKQNRSAQQYTYTSWRQAVRRTVLYGLPVFIIVCTVLLFISRNDRTEQEGKPAYTNQTAYGEHKSFKLPDGTKITLNAGSKLTVSPDFNKNLREITLDGEALLDVAHNRNKPFIIHTPSMDVRVLGTVLNIKAYSSDHKSETSLIKGMVEVTLKQPGKQKIILRPNQKIVIEKDGYQIKPGDARTGINTKDSNYVIRPLEESGADSAVNEILWTKAKLVFEDDSFVEIAAMLERSYDVTIELSDDVKTFRYTGTFDRKSIEEILNALQLSRYFEYTIAQNKKIRISRNKDN